MIRFTRRSTRSAMAAALVAGASLISLSVAPAAAEPVTPTVIAEDAATKKFFTYVDNENRLLFIDEAGRLMRYDPDTEASTELATGAILGVNEDLPAVAADFSVEDFTGRPGLLFFRGVGNTLQRIDLATDVVTNIATLGPTALVRRFYEDYEGGDVLLRIEDGSPFDRLHVFDPTAPALPAAVDTMGTSQRINSADATGTWFFQKGEDADTELWSVSAIGSTRLVDQPYIDDWGSARDGSVLYFQTEPPADVTTHWILDDATQPPVAFHVDDGSTFPQYEIPGRFARFGLTIVSLDNAYPDWELIAAPTLPGYSAPRVNTFYNATTDRLIAAWRYSPTGDSPEIEAPVFSYPLAGGTPIELDPEPAYPARDSRIFELFYGGVIEFVDNGDGTNGLTYTPPRSTTPRVIETTGVETLDVEPGFGRIFYQRTDGTFVSYSLERGDSAEVAGVGGDDLRVHRLGAEGEHLVIIRRCDNLITCPGAAIYVIETPDDFVPLGFTSVAPARLLDTRASGVTVDGESQRAGRAAAGSVTEFSIRDRGGIANLAGTALLNITAVKPSAGGFLTVYACDVTRPTASNLNFIAGDNRANAVIVEASADGRVCIYSSAETHLISDATGYAIQGAPAQAVTPQRYLETRDLDTFDGAFRNGGRVPAGETVEVDVAGRGDIDSFINTVLLNVTAVNPSSEGFLTVYPCGGIVPLASNLNFTARRTVANAVLTQVGVDGKVCVFASAETHVLVDVNGLDTLLETTRSMVPARLYDSRGTGETFDGGQRRGGRIPAGTVTEVDVRGRGAVGNDATAAFLNVTAVRPSIDGFLTVYPCGIVRPNASNVNAAAGTVTPNAAFSEIGANGKICIYNERETHLVVDIGGYVPDITDLLRRFN